MKRLLVTSLKNAPEPRIFGTFLGDTYTNHDKYLRAHGTSVIIEVVVLQVSFS